MSAARFTSQPVNCASVKLLLGAEPTAADPRVEAHLAFCAACRAFRDEISILDSRIRRVLLNDVFPRALREHGPSRRHRSRPAPRRLAIAASVLVAMSAGLAGWLGRAPSALAEEVVDHVVLEPHAWRTDRAVPLSALQLVLSRSGVRLSSQVGAVTYANACWFRGSWTPHLVVQTPEGAVTLLILPGERVAGAERFHEDGFTGIILPAEGGSIAVLSRGASDVETQARAFAAVLRWPSKRT